MVKVLLRILTKMLNCNFPQIIFFLWFDIKFIQNLLMWINVILYICIRTMFCERKKWFYLLKVIGSKPALFKNWIKVFLGKGRCYWKMVIFGKNALLIIVTFASAVRQIQVKHSEILMPLRDEACMAEYIGQASKSEQMHWFVAFLEEKVTGLKHV